MELFNIYMHIKNNLRWIFLTGLVFGFFGLLIYRTVPKTFRATGTLFVVREVETKNDFTYEGHYAQQNSISYSRNLVGLLESRDVRSQALELINIPVNEYTLRRLDRMVRVKHKNTQLVTLVVKGDTPQQVENLWGSLSRVAIEKSASVNTLGDPKISIIPLVERPVVEQTYSNKYLNIAIGFVFGTVVATFLSGFSDYIRANNLKKEEQK